jgi:hypothetical protein
MRTGTSKNEEHHTQWLVERIRRSVGRHLARKAERRYKEPGKNIPSFVHTSLLKDSVKDTPVDNVLYLLVYTSGSYSLPKIVMLEGMDFWADKKEKPTEDFHLDPNKIDPLEVLLEKEGPEGAFDELKDRLEKDPSDEEARRQALLLINRYAELISGLREKISH